MNEEAFAIFSQSVNKAIAIANSLSEATQESFMIITRVNNSKDSYVVEVKSGLNPDNPFPLEKFHLIDDIVSGFYKKRTNLNFTKLEHKEVDGNGVISIRLYTGPCLNPSDHEKIKWTSGSKARVINPEDCNGMDNIIEQGLNLSPPPSNS